MLIEFGSNSDVFKRSLFAVMSVVIITNVYSLNTFFKKCNRKIVSTFSCHGLDFPDSILSHFQHLSSSLAERSALLQKAIAQSQSVQESLDGLLQSIREVENSLEEEQVVSLSSGVVQEALATNMVRLVPQESAERVYLPPTIVASFW